MLIANILEIIHHYLYYCLYIDIIILIVILNYAT